MLRYTHNELLFCINLMMKVRIFGMEMWNYCSEMNGHLSLVIAELDKNRLDLADKMECEAG